jgi:hypothetical protein
MVARRLQLTPGVMRSIRVRISRLAVAVSLVAFGALGATENPCPPEFSLFGIGIGMTVEDLLRIHPDARFKLGKYGAHEYHFRLKPPFAELAIRSADVTVVVNRVRRVCQVQSEFSGSVPAVEVDSYFSRTWGRQNLFTSHGGPGWASDCGAFLRRGLRSRRGKATNVLLEWGLRERDSTREMAELTDMFGCN